MSYDNAEPKVLKTLNSSGQVLDDSGNVINDTSDYWVQLYNQTEPKADKILKSDGTVVDSAGNLIQDTTEFNVQKYNQAEPIPAKYLHADGTIDENSGSGGVELEDNKTITITKNGEISINPSQGYDAMKKVTVTTNVFGYDFSNNARNTFKVFELTNSEKGSANFLFVDESSLTGAGKAVNDLSLLPEIQFHLNYITAYRLQSGEEVVKCEVSRSGDTVQVRYSYFDGTIKMVTYTGTISAPATQINSLIDLIRYGRYF